MPRVALLSQLSGEQMKFISVATYAGILACALVQPVWAREPAKFTERVVYSFCSQQGCADGYYPEASLVAENGNLYGTTNGGGSTACHGHGCGTVFSLDPDTGTETVVYAFLDGPDGAHPKAGLVDVKGILYGTTYKGFHRNGKGHGSKGRGAVFSLDPITDTLKVIHIFTGGRDGEHPVAGLIDIKSVLYGTTFWGGASRGGTVFRVSRNHDKEKVVYSFCGQPYCTDGREPVSGLIDVNGVLYGTTRLGGNTSCNSAGCGTIFSLNPSTGLETVVYAFSGSSTGSNPYAGLINENGILYGTTTGSGSGNGIVFSFDTDTGVEKEIYAFRGGADGFDPWAGLINVRGLLYGTTRFGGGNGCGGAGCGTVFSLDPNTGAETVVHSFSGDADGEFPTAALIDVNGTLYGTTLQGGAHHRGTVFALTKQ